MAKMKMFTQVFNNVPTRGQAMVWSPDVSNADFDLDNDGQMGTVHRGYIDLSHVCSQMTGKQQSMMANYRVGYLRISLQNQNDIADNSAGAMFGGQLHWYTPNKHNVKALKMLRTLHNADNKDSAQNMFTDTPDYKRYKGLRIPMYTHSETNAPIYKPSSIPTWFNAFATQPNMHELFDIYCRTQPADAGDYENELWTQRTGGFSSLSWSASLINSMQNALGDAGITYNPSNNAFEWEGEIDVLTGLMRLDITHCSTDPPTNLLSVPPQVDDDFMLEVTIGVLGWSDF